MLIPTSWRRRLRTKEGQQCLSSLSQHRAESSSRPGLPPLSPRPLNPHRHHLGTKKGALEPIFPSQLSHQAVKLQLLVQPRSPVWAKAPQVYPSLWGNLLKDPTRVFPQALQSLWSMVWGSLVSAEPRVLVENPRPDRVTQVMCVHICVCVHRYTQASNCLSFVNNHTPANVTALRTTDSFCESSNPGISESEYLRITQNEP